MIAVEDNTGASTNPVSNKRWSIPSPDSPDVDRALSVILPGELHSYFQQGVTDHESEVDAASPSKSVETL